LNPGIILVWLLSMLFAYESSAEPNIEVIDAYNRLTMGESYKPYEKLKQQYAQSDQCTVVNGPGVRFRTFDVWIEGATTLINLRNVDWSTVRYRNLPVKKDSIEVIAECLKPCRSYKDVDGNDWGTTLVAAAKQQGNEKAVETMGKFFDKGRFYATVIGKQATLEDAIAVLSNACPPDTENQ